MWRHWPVLIVLITVIGSAIAEPVLTVLDNGLTVITEELHYAPVVSTVVAYRVGSRNEPEGLTGMSHFCEHMMFKGTADMPKGRFWQIVQRNGGWANAFTSEDVTTYFLVFPSTRLDDALRIESDRMSNCLFDSAEVASERNVVHEERRMRSVDSPSGALYEALVAEAYTAHTYGRPVIGFEQDILAYDAESACCYYSSWYTPSNAVLCVVGDFDTDELLSAIEEYFGSIDGGPAPGDEGIPIEPGQMEARYVEIEHPSNLGRLSMAFHTPSGLHPDSRVLDLIGMHLSSGRSSRLEHVLVQTGLASSVGVWNDGGMDPGLFTISATLMPGVEPDAVMEVVWSELDSLSSVPIEEEELEDLLTRIEAAHVFQSASPVGSAISMALNQVMFDDYLKSEKDLAALERLTTEDIQRVASTWFGRDLVTIAVLKPLGGAGEASARERESLPTDIQEPSTVDFEGLEIPAEMLELPATSISEGVIEYTLENGLRLLIRRDPTFPIATVAFGIPLASLRQPPELAGLAAVACDAALYGTLELPYEEFHRRLERRGSYVRFGTSEEYASGSVGVLVDDLELALQTVADLLRRPAFREEDLEHVIDEHLASLERRRESVFSVATDNLARMMSGSPEMAMIPSEETLGAIERSDVVEFFDRCSRPDGTVIVVVGDVDPESVQDMVSGMFEDWTAAPDTLPDLLPQEPSTRAGSLYVETMPGRVQAGVVVGGFAPGYESPDFEVFNVMNRILGAGIGSRLGRYVRDEQGLAYYVGSRLYTLAETGALVALLSTRTDYAEQALGSVVETIENMTEEEVDPVELRLVQASMVGNHALSNMSYSGIARTLMSNAMRSRPLDYDVTMLSEVLSIEASDVLDVARTYLGDSEFFVSVAGGVDAELAPVSR